MDEDGQNLVEDFEDARGENMENLDGENGQVGTNNVTLGAKPATRIETAGGSHFLDVVDQRLHSQDEFVVLI